MYQKNGIYTYMYIVKLFTSFNSANSSQRNCLTITLKVKSMAIYKPSPSLVLPAARISFPCQSRRQKTFKQIKLRPHKTQQQQTATNNVNNWQTFERAAEKKREKTENKISQQKWPKSDTDKKLVDTKLYTHCIWAIWACQLALACTPAASLSLLHSVARSRSRTQPSAHFVSAQFKFQWATICCNLNWTRL